MFRPIITAICLFTAIMASAISINFEKTWLDLDTKTKKGVPAIAAHAKLHISGIKGQDFDLVAIVQDDNGEWHKNRQGDIVKTHYKVNATYDDSTWENIMVYIRHNRLAPKPGKHEYKVYLYIYYDGKWLDGKLAGTYSLTGSSSSSKRSSSSTSSSSTRRSSSSTQRHSSTHRHSSTQTGTCGVCQGSGIMTGLLCNGAGGSQQWRCLTYPPYSQYYEWVTCMACGGNGHVACTWCKGTGEVQIAQPSTNYNTGTYNNSNNYYNNYGSSVGSSSSSSSSTYSTCPICHGSGVCTSCGGRGGEWRDTGYYTGSGSKSWIDCPSCNGKKTCFNCFGTGRI